MRLNLTSDISTQNQCTYFLNKSASYICKGHRKGTPTFLTQSTLFQTHAKLTQNKEFTRLKILKSIKCVAFLTAIINELFCDNVQILLQSVSVQMRFNVSSMNSKCQQCITLLYDTTYEFSCHICLHTFSRQKCFSQRYLKEQKSIIINIAPILNRVFFYDNNAFVASVMVFLTPLNQKNCKTHLS